MKNPKYWRKRTTEDKLGQISMLLLQLELAPATDSEGRFDFDKYIKGLTKAIFQKQAKKLRRRQRRIEEGKFEDK